MPTPPTGSAAPSPVVLTEALSHVYRSGFLGRKKVPAVSGVSLTVGRGEVFTLLGPNGSGKTTFLKVLLGLLKPTGGKISVLGRPPGHPLALARIGYMAETPAFLPLLTGEETLHLAGRIFGLDRRRRKSVVGELLHRVDLERDGKRPVGDYSQGMQKRIALAQALINDPELLLLDEPTAGLDPASAENVQKIVREKARAGNTVLLSSHLLSRVEEVATKVCILHEGRVTRMGSLQEVAGIPGTFDLRVKGGKEAEAVRSLQDAGFTVESSGPASHSLRDVFLEVTGGKDGGEADPDLDDTQDKPADEPTA